MNRTERIAWTWVAAQLAAVVAVLASARVWRFEPTWPVRALGVALVAAGFVAGAWAVPHLGKGLTPVPLPNGRTGMVTAGPYRFVRHPMYSAVMAAMLGVALVAGSRASLLGWVVLVSVLTAKARWEEQRLAEHFDGYPRYSASTPRFIPTPFRRRPS